MSPMSDQPVTLAVLAKFHREVILPDMHRVFEDLFERRITPRFDEMNARFDAIHHKLERLETDYEFFRVGLARVEERLEVLEHQYQDLLAGLHRLEERLSRLEDRLSRVEAQVDQVAADRDREPLRAEITDLRARVDVLQLRVRNLEKRVDREPEP